MQGNMRKEEDDDGGFAVESQNLAQGGFGKGVGGGVVGSKEQLTDVVVGEGELVLFHDLCKALGLLLERTLWCAMGAGGR